jgi:creatinine amidohydrolase
MSSSLTDAHSSQPTWGRYGDLRPHQIEAIRDRASVAFVPWGALEWHCLHAPIGLDNVKAENICLAIAERTGGVVLPAIPLGVNTIKPFKGFAHSIDISEGLAAQVAEEICLQLADEGFSVVILMTGHYPQEQIDALEEAVRRARLSAPKTVYEVWADNRLLGDAFQGDHAGATETSFQLLFDPASVDTSSLPNRPLTLDGDGVMGEDPREASADRGRAQLEVILENAIPLVERLLEEAKDA